MYHNQLVYLVEAVRKNSIRKAARSLGLSQPSLSAAIIALEKEVGVRLLDRSSRGVSVTPEGQRFVALAEDIVDKSAALRSLYSVEEGQQVQTLTVATNPSQVTARVLRELSPCLGQGELRVTVLNFSVEGCAESVRSLESEVGVVFITSGCHKNYMSAFRESLLEYHRLSTRTCCVNLGPQNPLYHREKVTRQEVLDFPLARFVEDDLSLLDFSVVTDGIGLSHNKRIFYFNSDSAILSFVAQTDAYKIGYSWCREDYERFGIRCLEFDPPSSPLELGWIKRKDRQLSGLALRFVETLTRLFREGQE